MARRSAPLVPLVTIAESPPAGSGVQPISEPSRDQIARRSSGQPWVCVYPLRFSSMALIAARFSSSGTGKSGWPIERLIGSLRCAARSKTLRIPLASIERARRERSLERSRAVSIAGNSEA